MCFFKQTIFSWYFLNCCSFKSWWWMTTFVHEHWNCFSMYFCLTHVDHGFVTYNLLWLENFCFCLFPFSHFFKIKQGLLLMFFLDNSEHFLARIWNFLNNQTRAIIDVLNLFLSQRWRLMFLNLSFLLQKTL